MCVTASTIAKESFDFREVTVSPLFLFRKKGVLFMLVQFCLPWEGPGRYSDRFLGV